MDNIVLFGASNHGKVAQLNLGKKYNIMYFCDNDSSKYGSRLNNVEIISSKQLSKIYNEQLKIVISSQYHDEISKQLIDMGIFNIYYFVNDTILPFSRDPLKIQMKKQTMLTTEELFYLYTLTKDQYIGEGEIIDAGCLLGGSTVAFAEGLINNQKVNEKIKYEKIHSYDLFLYDTYMNGLEFETRPNINQSLLPAFSENVNEYQNYLRIYPGDFLTKKWGGDNIELLFIDLSKSIELNNHLIKIYFQYLIPNRSIIIQQDYYHHYCFWIHITMEYLKDFFEPLEYAGGGTLPFKLIKKIPLEILEYDFMQYTPKEELIELMNSAIRKHGNKVGLFQRNELNKARENLFTYLEKRK